MSGLKPKSTYVFVTVFIILITSPLTSTSHVTLTTDGYQNVVVSIEENSGFISCQEDLENIKELIQSTSISFAHGLERPAYFGNVTIILPDTWVSDPICSTLMTLNNVTLLPWARIHNADIKFISDHPVFGNQPHSFQYGGCREPGLSINVPSSFVSNTTDLTKGRIMAREWAHYRYGVFDEGGIPDDERHPSGYVMFQTESSDKVMRANICSGGKTPMGQWNNEECKSTTSVNSSCEFLADVYNPDILSSLMYRPDLDHMEKFCTKENHDDSVPSKLSYHCGSFSSSEVIYKHLDFTPGVTPTNTSAEINFNVIQNPFSGYHIILDTASFINKETFEAARSSLMQFIGFLLDPILLSIDTYDGVNVIELQPPIYLDPQTSEELLVKLIEVDYVNGSPNNLSLALDRAQVRASNGQDVILLTSTPTIPDLTNWVTSYKEKKINIHLVHFGVSTSKTEMAKLAHYGSVNIIPNVADSFQMSSYTWAVNTLQSIYAQTRIYRAKFLELSIIKNSTSETNKSGTFYLDSPTSRLLVSLYSMKPDGDLWFKSFSIFRPDGYQVWNETYENDAFLYTNFYIFVVGRDSLESLPPGLWRYNIVFQRSLSVQIVQRLDIWAEAFDYSQIQLRTWNSALDNQPLDFTKAPVGLYAQLTQNRKPIRGANVTAYVYVTDSSGLNSILFGQIPLLDQGISDVTSGDGIYSAWLTSPSYTTLSYSVFYNAYGVNSLAVVDNGTYTKPPTTGSVIPMSNPVATAPQFTRYQYGSSFQLVALLSSSFDLIRPQRITDLIVLSYNTSTRMAKLGWTAPKDNYGSGEIITRYALYEAVGSADYTYTEHTVTADTMANLTVQVPYLYEGEFVKYRIAGKDSSNNMAEHSNVASMAGPALQTGGISSSAMWALIGVAIAILLIILIIVLIRWCCPVEAKRKQRQATRKMRQLFSSSDKAAKRVETVSAARYQSPPPTIQQWSSPTISQHGDIPDAKRKSDSLADHQPQVELRQQSAESVRTSTYGSERIYFGQEDINRMITGPGPRRETYSERGTEEIIKRAPSMVLQLATILRKNSSNLSMNRVGLDENVTDPRPTEVIKPRVYARPFKLNQTTNRPMSNQPASRGYSYTPNKPLSMSETNLYYTDVALRPPGAQSNKSSPSSSYLSVYAEQKANVVPQPQQASGQSSLANALRNGIRGNEEWQDSNSFIYTDPRFEGQPKGPSSFDPQLHPANQLGLPPSLPNVPPPYPPRTYNTVMGYDDDFRSSHMSVNHNGQDQQAMSRSSSKPSLVSGV